MSAPRRWISRAWFCVWLALGSKASAQSVVREEIIEIRGQATDSLFASITQARQLRSGFIIVNDPTTHRLTLLDSDLVAVAILADTTGRSGYGYGVRKAPGGIVRYRGDSTLFAHAESKVFWVLDQRGRIVNVIAPVHPKDVAYVADLANGEAVSDAVGAVYYRGVRTIDDTHWRLPSLGEPSLRIDLPDSAPVLRADFDTRDVDTIAMARIPRSALVLSRRSNGALHRVAEFSAFEFGDDWAVLTDGTVAIVRGDDYHVDWYARDGTSRSSAPVPFIRRPLSSVDKASIRDSVKRSTVVMSNSDPRQSSNSLLSSVDEITVSVIGIPDWYPPFRVGQTRVDNRDRLWVLPTFSQDGSNGIGVVYDVLDRFGTLVSKVRLPVGRRLVGFGNGNVVLMANVIATNRIVLELGEISSP